MERITNLEVQIGKLKKTLDHVLAQVSEMDIEQKALRLYIERLEKQLGADIKTGIVELERIRKNMKSL